MGKHLMVEKFVAVRRLNQPVQEENPAESPVFDDLDSLIGGASGVENPVRFKKNAAGGSLIFPEFGFSRAPSRARGRLPGRHGFSMLD
jgi:hypothetical protein